MKTTKIRPSHHNSNEISFLWTPGEKLVELVHADDGLNFAIRNGSGPVETAKTVDSFSPISWLEAYVRVGALRLPSEAAPNVNLEDLAARIRGFVHRYFDCTTLFESVAVLYVLHTWLYERFQAVPYLRFLGLPGSGKTRGTEAIGALCYRPLVMAGSATPAPMFRLIEAIGGTMLIDEADFRFSQIGSDIIRILNCGYQQGLPVPRMEKNAQGEFVPRIYEVFGPKIINGRRAFQDDATETRCLVYSPLSSERQDIPTQLPPAFYDEATEIQNFALGWRMENLDSFDLTRGKIPGLRGRASQLSVPLGALAAALNAADSNRYQNDLIEFCNQREKQAEADRRDTVEGKLLSAYVSWKGRTTPTCKDLVQEILETNADDTGLRRWLSPNRASGTLRSMGFQTHHTNRGSELLIDPARLQGLCQRFGVTPGSDDRPSKPRLQKLWPIRPAQDRDEGDEGDGPDDTCTTPTAPAQAQHIQQGEPAESPPPF